MPTQRGDDAGPFGDQVVAMIYQQPPLALAAIEAHNRQV